MKTRHQTFADMLALQAALNDVALPDWRDNPPDYPLAILSEASELADAIGWKWWKKDGLSPLQAQMEVVDIWHFVLSQLLVSRNEHRLFRLAFPDDSLLGGGVPSLSNEHQKTVALDYLKELVCLTLSKEILDEDTLRVLGSLTINVGLTVQTLGHLYICKAALNLFRWSHGYKDGTYVKDWLGEEDSVYLEKYLASVPMDSITPASIASALEARYQVVTAK